jgi:hypothetical protein
VPTTTAEAPATPEPAESLVGRWAHFDTVAYQDEVMKTLIISTGFADLEMRDGQLWNQMVFCHADVVNDQGIEISISDEATSAILPVATPVEVNEVDGRVCRGACAPTRPPSASDWTTRPTSRCPPIPTIPGSSTPTATATRASPPRCGSARAWRARSTSPGGRSSPTAGAGEPDRLVGTITDRSEQLIIGASDPMFLAGGQWEQIDDPSRNPVIWQRVDADWDCDPPGRRTRRPVPTQPHDRLVTP